MFDSTNVNIREGSSKSSSSANADVEFNSPVIVKRSDENSKFIMICSGTKAEHNLFDIAGSHIDIVKYSSTFDKEYGSDRHEWNYWKQTTRHTVKILQIVCVGNGKMIVEYVSLNVNEGPKHRVTSTEYEKFKDEEFAQ